MKNTEIDDIDSRIRDLDERIESLTAIESLQKIEGRIKDVEIKLNLREDLEEEEVSYLHKQLNHLKKQFFKEKEISDQRYNLENQIVLLKEKRHQLKKEEEKILRELLSVVLEYKTRLLKNPSLRLLAQWGTRRSPSHILKQINEIFDINGEFELFLPYFLKFAKKEGIKIDLIFYLAITTVLNLDETRVVPEYITKFIISYIGHNNHENIIDPWAKNGSLLVPILQKYNHLNALGVLEDPKYLEILNLLYDELEIKWETTKVENLDTESFDLIVGFPEWGFTSGSNSAIYYPIVIDDLENQIKKIELINILKLLKNNGTALILLPKWIMSWKIKKGFISDLKKIGVYIDSILEIPDLETALEFGKWGTFYISDGFLMVFKRVKNPNLFVAELSNKIDQDVVLYNLLNGKSGKIPQLGLNTPLEKYNSLKSVTAALETKKMGLNAGLKPIPTRDIFDKIIISCKPEQTNIDKIVYLQFDHLSSKMATDSFEELKCHECYHIQLNINTEKASQGYVKNYFNSEIGQKLLESWIDDDLRFLETYKNLDRYKSGSDESFFNDLSYYFQKRVIDSQIYLPDLKEQLEILKLSETLSELVQQISDYQKKLLKHPLKYGEIKKSVELYKAGNKFDYWLGSLPYPISSILFACSADSNPEYRVRSLIHFFEALSEFNATIILSSIISDPMMCINEFKECLTSSKYPRWYLNPNFGNWNFLGKCISKKVRNLLSSKEREHIIQLFGYPNIKFLETITNKKLYQLLDEGLGYRNKWIGHGPPVNLEENQRRLSILKNLLLKTQHIISNNYEDTLFIQPVPGSMSYDGGIFNTTVKQLVGRLPFKDRKVETTHPLKDKTLYLMHSGQYEAIELLPFFRIMPGPKTEQNACYFYNSYDARNVGGEVGLVSYHFAQEPTVSVPSDEFKTLISIFNHKND